VICLSHVSLDLPFPLRHTGLPLKHTCCISIAWATPSPASLHTSRGSLIYKLPGLLTPLPTSGFLLSMSAGFLHLSPVESAILLADTHACLLPGSCLQLLPLYTAVPFSAAIPLPNLPFPLTATFLHAYTALRTWVGTAAARYYATRKTSSLCFAALCMGHSYSGPVKFLAGRMAIACCTQHCCVTSRLRLDLLRRATLRGATTGTSHMRTALCRLPASRLTITHQHVRATSCAWAPQTPAPAPDTAHRLPALQITCTPANTADHRLHYTAILTATPFHFTITANALGFHACTCVDVPLTTPASSIYLPLFHRSACCYRRHHACDGHAVVGRTRCRRHHCNTLAYHLCHARTLASTHLTTARLLPTSDWG